MNNQLFFEQLFQSIRGKKTLAIQDIYIDKPEVGMLCRTAEFEKNPDIFYLITGIGNQVCDVIPGNLDGLTAGPEDIVLPPDVLGDYISLSMSLSGTIPLSAVGNGFAVLDDDTYNRVIDSQIQYETGTPGEQPSFPFALPYISAEDSRIAVHQKMLDLIQWAQVPLCAMLTEEEESVSPVDSLRTWFAQQFQPVFDMPSVALAAGNKVENQSAMCHIDGFPGSVFLEYSAEEKTLAVSFYDAAGEADTVHWEHWQIADGNGRIIGSVTNGTAVIHDLDSFDGQCCLLDPEQKIHAFVKSAE